MGEYANPDALVTTDWVAEHLDDASIKLVEVDEDTEAYEKGHIPGATSFHWRKELQDPVNRDFVDQAHFEQLLSRKGIGNDDLVVLYGGNNNWFAAYAYWYLKVYGHDNVKLMNGGRKKWELEGRELSGDAPNITATSYTAKPADPTIRALRDEVIAAVGNKPMIDVRSPDEFSGKLAAPAHLPQEQAQRKGHIPGAKNVPWSKAANEDGTFKSIEELKALYQEEQGLVPEDETIAYCRIGERSSHTWFVLSELLGFPKVKNYDGSWTEYGSLVGVPIQLDHKEEAPV
ncbi:MAG: sulfurtransferase [Candidatus Dormibacteraeota bacterium]|nr:sulfurtransferase [Candidatus Dormibacteraeota bacterium]